MALWFPPQLLPRVCLHLGKVSRTLTAPSHGALMEPTVLTRDSPRPSEELELWPVASRLSWDPGDTEWGAEGLGPGCQAPWAGHGGEPTLHFRLESS